VEKEWACAVGFTHEFGERAVVAEEDYYRLPTWDVQPPDEAMFQDIGKLISACANKFGPTCGSSLCVRCRPLNHCVVCRLRR
jgi:hypothetical protein